MKNTMLWLVLGVALITIASGIYNFKFIGGTSDVKPVNIALSILTYILWIITSVQIIRTSAKPVQTCFKISIVLVACFIFGALLFSPLTGLLVSPLLGICMLTDSIDLFLMVALLYGGIVILDWLWVTLLVCHRRKQ